MMEKRWTHTKDLTLKIQVEVEVQEDEDEINPHIEALKLG